MVMMIAATETPKEVGSLLDLLAGADENLPLVPLLHKHASNLYDALELVSRDANGDRPPAVANAVAVLCDTLIVVTKTADRAARASVFKRVFYGPSYADALVRAGHTLAELVSGLQSTMQLSFSPQTLAAELASAQKSQQALYLEQMQQLLAKPQGDLYRDLALDDKDVPDHLAALHSRIMEEQSNGLMQQLFKHMHATIARHSMVHVEKTAAEQALASLTATAFDFSDDIDETSVLGRGGFGEVVRATWLAPGTQVAIKRLLPLEGRLAQDRPVLDLIAKEALVWSNMRHPNILQLLGVSLTCDVPFLVMPLMAGGDLTRYALAHPDEHLSLLHQAAQGMAYLHSKRILHGDLKGTNILVDAHGTVKICDFGQARALSAASRASTFQQGTVGNVRWVAPERYKRKAVYQLEPDVFAFAMVMYEVVSGMIPFHEEHDLEVIKDWIKDGDRPDAPETAASYSPVLWTLVEQCWAHDWTTRPTFAVIVAQLDRLSKTSAIGAAAPRAVLMPAVTAADVPPILGPPDLNEVKQNTNSEEEIALDMLLLSSGEAADTSRPAAAMDLPPQAAAMDLPPQIATSDLDAAPQLPTTMPVVPLDLFHGLTAPTELAGDCAIWDLRMELASGTVMELALRGKPVGPAGHDILQRALTHPQHRMTKLKLSACKLGPSGAAQLAQFLPPTLTDLYLSDNEIGDSGAIAIAATLPRSLTRLNLENNGIGEKGAIALAAALPPSLTKLGLSRNQIGETGAIAIVAALPRSLMGLGLGGNRIGKEGAIALAATLPPSLTSLDLSNNRIYKEGAIALAAALPPSLTSLDLFNNRIGEGAIELAAMLPRSLMGLGLGYNRIGEGAIALAAMLPPSLTSLDLSNNGIGEGAIALAAMLPPSLTSLDLSNNRIYEEGAIALAAKLPPSLIELYLSRNQIGDAGAAAIAAALPRSLTGLGLENNGIGEKGAIALAATLPPSLTKLYLTRNQIGDAGAIAIAAKLPPSLIELYLSRNQIGDAGAVVVRQLWASRSGTLSL